MTSTGVKRSEYSSLHTGIRSIRLTVRVLWFFLMLDTYTDPPEFFIPYRRTGHSWSAFAACSWNQEKPVSDRIWFCQGRALNSKLPAVPPWFTVWPVHLAEYLHIPGNWRMPSRHRILDTRKYLSLCPLRSIWQTASRPGSHPPGLSVRAWISLSPLQRFSGLLN